MTSTGLKKDLYRDLEASMAGIELAVGVLVGVGLGYLADRYLGTSPFGMIIGFIIGAIAGFRNAFRLAAKSEKKNEGEDAKRDGNSGT